MFNRMYRPAMSAGAKTAPWFEIRAAAGDTTEILIYDFIDAFGVSAKDFVEDLRKVNTKNILLRINSPGGDVFDGIAILNALRAHKAHKVVMIDGIAASIAAIIAMAGDEIVMADNAFMMIHNSWGFAVGNANDMMALAAVLEKIDGSVAQTFAGRTGISEKDIRAMMDAETWMAAKDAVAQKFADRIEDLPIAKDMQTFDLSVFRKPPQGAAEAPDTAAQELMKRRLMLAERGFATAR